MVGAALLALQPIADHDGAVEDVRNASRRVSGRFLAVGLDGRPARWPCEPVPYWVDERGTSLGAVRLVHLAVADTARVLGVPFEFAGRPPVTTAPRRGVTIRWMDPAPGRLVDGDELAATDVRWRREGARVVIVRATVAVNSVSTSRMPLTFSGRGLGPVLLHELGHAAGLDHVGSPSIMRQGLPHPTGWQAEDLRALRAVAPCTPDPVSP